MHVFKLNIIPNIEMNSQRYMSKGLSVCIEAPVVEAVVSFLQLRNHFPAILQLFPF